MGCSVGELGDLVFVWYERKERTTAKCEAFRLRLVIVIILSTMLKVLSSHDDSVIATVHSVHQQRRAHVDSRTKQTGLLCNIRCLRPVHSTVV